MQGQTIDPCESKAVNYTEFLIFALLGHYKLINTN